MEKEVWRKFRSKGVQVIGIDIGDPVDLAREFRSRHKLTYPVLLDSGQKILYRFSPEGGIPHLAIIGKDSKLLYSKNAGNLEDLVAKLNKVIKAKHVPGQR